MQTKIKSLTHLGRFLSQFGEFPFVKRENIAQNDTFFDEFIAILQKAEQQNTWFTSDNLQFTCHSWAQALTEEKITRWVKGYSFRKVPPKKILIIMAGNIPLVGFHDFLSVYVSGNQPIVKMSSDDKVILPFIAKYLQAVDPSLSKDFFVFTDEKVSDFEAVIATGSNNTARYFEYYFANKPHIIRKNRNSVAVLTGSETPQELHHLGNDIFRYYGLGCRSVSKIFVPENYDFDLFFKAIFPFSEIINQQKYANNYDYNKAVYLMSLYKLRENGFLMLKEDTGYASPIATLFYEYYSDENSLRLRLSDDKDKIQCIVSKGFTPDEIPFGKTQEPQLWDYADKVDTLSFLENI